MFPKITLKEKLPAVVLWFSLLIGSYNAVSRCCCTNFPSSVYLLFSCCPIKVDQEWPHYPLQPEPTPSDYCDYATHKEGLGGQAGASALPEGLNTNAHIIVERLKSLPLSRSAHDRFAYSKHITITELSPPESSCISPIIPNSLFWDTLCKTSVYELTEKAGSTWSNQTSA